MRARDLLRGLLVAVAVVAAPVAAHAASPGAAATTPAPHWSSSSSGRLNHGPVAAPAPVVARPPAPSGNIVATPTTSGCPDSAPLWHVLYQVYMVGSDGTTEPAATLTGAEAAANAFAQQAGTSTNCALRVAVTVESMTIAAMVATADAGSPYYDLVFSRAPSTQSASGGCWSEFSSTNQAEPLGTEVVVNDSAACGGSSPSQPDATWLLAVLSSAHGVRYGYGLADGQWSAPTHLAVSATAKTLTVAAGDTSIASGVTESLDFAGQRYGGVITAAVTDSASRVVAQGQVTQGQLRFARPLVPGSYRVCLTAPALGRWRAAQKCFPFVINAPSGSLLHTSISARGLVLTAASALRGHTVSVQFVYETPSCHGTPPTNMPCNSLNGLNATSSPFAVRLAAHVLIPLPAGWTQKTQPRGTVTMAAFTAGGVHYPSLYLEVPWRHH